MSTHSRRRFLAGAAAVPLGLWAQRLTYAQTKKPAVLAVRSDVSTPNGQANLRKYAKAVGLLRQASAKSAANPVSWVFQWYTHATPTDKATLINQTYPGCNPSAWCNLAKAAWETCEPHFSDTSHEWYFLPWHRMYVYYLEQICRVVLKDATFALPYWDYTRNAVLPQPFRLPNDPTFGPLYNKNRGPGINDGDEIDTTSALTQLMNQALCESGYVIQGLVNGFCAELDWYLHGTVHGAIGGDMSIVPTAGNDPIFWMHHCNIDRLWASWNNNGGTNPGDASYLNQSYTFANGNGAAETAVVKNVLMPSTLGYRYDRLQPKPTDCPPAASQKTLTAAAAEAITDRAPGAVTLGAQAVRVALRPAPSVAATNPVERIKALPQTARLSLVIRNIRSDVAPGVNYGVYLNAPEGASGQQLEARRVGVISFFDSVPHGNHKPLEGKFYRFDITAAARDLAAKGGLGDGLSVTIAPRGQAAPEAKPVLGEVIVVRH